MAKKGARFWDSDKYDVCATTTPNYFLLVKDVSFEKDIIRQSITSGIHQFEVGKTYHKFGNTKLTSSGYISFEYLPPNGIEYVGYYDESEDRRLLLFKGIKDGKYIGQKKNLFGNLDYGFHADYKSIYMLFVWSEQCLIIQNSVGSGRVILMDE